MSECTCWCSWFEECCFWNKNTMHHGEKAATVTLLGRSMCQSLWTFCFLSINSTLSNETQHLRLGFKKLMSIKRTQLLVCSHINIYLASLLAVMSNPWKSRPACLIWKQVDPNQFHSESDCQYLSKRITISTVHWIHGRHQIKLSENDHAFCVGSWLFWVCLNFECKLQASGLSITSLLDFLQRAIFWRIELYKIRPGDLRRVENASLDNAMCCKRGPILVGLKTSTCQKMWCVAFCDVLRWSLVRF
jgi:hypothetical protein